MKIATKTKTETGVTFKFENGESVTVNLDDFEGDMIQKLAIHGVTQKLGDSYASAESVSEAVERFYGVFNALKAGDWNVGKSAATGGIWVEALAQASGKTLEEAQELFASMGEEKQKAVKKHPEVKLAKLAITAGVALLALWALVPHASQLRAALSRDRALVIPCATFAIVSVFFTIATSSVVAYDPVNLRLLAPVQLRPCLYK